MTVVLERDISLAESYQSALGGGGAIVGSLDELDAHLIASPEESAIIIGPSLRADEAAEVAERLRVLRPSLSVILVRTRVDTTVLTTALRAGIREVVDSRDLNGLVTAVSRAHALWAAMSDSEGPGPRPIAEHSKRGMLVTSFSPKGGVGKSTLATNLAAAIAGNGRRVCLVDLDLENGDVAIMLQIMPSRTLADLAGTTGGIDRSSIEPLLLQHSENLSVLVAPALPHAVERLSPDVVGRALDLLRTMFDAVVVDTSGGFDDYSLQALDHSDVVMLVATLDIPALKSIKVATETLKLLNVPRERWRLVLNRADAKVGLSQSDCAQTLEMEVAASLPSCREVPASVNSGQVMVTAHPRHPFSQCIRTLAADLPVTQRHIAPAHAAEPEPRRLLRRRVNRS